MTPERAIRCGDGRERQWVQVTLGLTVCCGVGEPPRREAAMLAPLREVADEILVAVDDRIPLAELAPLRAIADAVHVMSYPGTNNPLRAQLFAYATTSWILALDADEV